MKIEKKTIRLIFLCVLGCIAFYWLLHEPVRVKVFFGYITGIFSPFVIGGVLAFILNVPMRAIEAQFKFVRSEKARRILAILLTIIAVAAVIAGVICLVIPQLNETIQALFAQLPGFFERVQKAFMAFLQERPELMEWVKENIGLKSLDWSGILEKVAATVSNSLTALINSAISAVSGLAGAVFNAVVSVVFSFYCLSRKETLARQGRKMLYAIAPEKFADETVRILRMTNSTFSNFLTGQCLEAVILGLLFLVAMAIARMPYIPLICTLITVTALVPLVGAFIGCALGALFIFVSDPGQALVFVIMFLVIQQFEGNVIYPRVVGESIGLPGMWVLLAVAVGGGLWGVLGMFLMVPFASVIYTLLREFTQKRLEKRNIDPDKLTEHPPQLQSHFKMKRDHRKKMRLAKKIAKQCDTEKDPEEQ